MAEVLLTLFGSFVVGVIGAVLGVGGGTFLVPFLVLVAHLRPVEAVGISLFCVIGTSVGGGSAALKSGQANVGLALVIEPFLVITAVGASLLAQQLADALLLALFGVMLLGVGGLFLYLFQKNLRIEPHPPEGRGHFVDGVVVEPARGEVRYRPQRVPLLAGLVALTGAAAGLFGIGGGVLNVPFMTLVSRVPLRAAASTSVLMMSVTGAAAGAVHLAHGAVPGALVGASLLGVVPGGLLGARLQRLLPEQWLRLAFSTLAVLIAFFTFQRAWELW